MTNDMFTNLCIERDDVMQKICKNSFRTMFTLLCCSHRLQYFQPIDFHRLLPANKSASLSTIWNYCLSQPYSAPNWSRNVSAHRNHSFSGFWMQHWVLVWFLVVVDGNFNYNWNSIFLNFMFCILLCIEFLPKWTMFFMYIYIYIV